MSNNYQNISDAELEAIVLESGVDTTFLRRVYPPQFKMPYRSFFGGLPRLPKELDWPTENIEVDWSEKPLIKNIACTFLAQIDCNQLPRTGHVEKLPKDGILYFFFSAATAELQLSEKPGEGGKVIYWNGDSQNLKDRSPPDNLHYVYGVDTEYHYGWLKEITTTEYDYPKIFTKWEITHFIGRTYGVDRLLLERYPSIKIDYKNDDPDTKQIKQDIFSRAHEIQSFKRNQSLQSSFPVPLKRNYFVIPREQISKWRPENGFPCSWICFEIFSGLLLKQILKDLKRNRIDEFPELTKFIQDLKDWVKKSRVNGRYTKVSDQEIDKFWQWYEVNKRRDSLQDPRHWAHLEKALAEAYRIGARLCLSYSPDALKLVNKSYIEDQRWQHHVHLSGHGGRMVQHKILSAEMDQNLGPDYLLLIQFDSDEGINWEWCDAGVVQFWIKREELQDLNFENVIVKTYGG